MASVANCRGGCSMSGESIGGIVIVVFGLLGWLLLALRRLYPHLFKSDSPIPTPDAQGRRPNPFRPDGKYEPIVDMEGVWHLLGLIGIWTVIAAVLVLGYECVFWLRYGVWPGYKVFEFWIWAGLPMPETPGLLGVQKIIIWIMESSLVGTLLVGGVGLAYVSFWREQKASDRAKARQREGESHGD